MSPEQQNLEEFFQSTKPGDGLSDDFDLTDERTEFDTFFEKLSTLEDLDWSDSSESPPVSLGNTEWDPVASRGVSHQPQTFHNTGRTTPSRDQLSQSTTTATVRSRRAEGSYASVANTVVKFCMMASILFAFGMGAGWLALSLPDRFTNAGPAAPPTAKEEGGQPAEEISGGSQAVTVVEAVLPVATPVPATAPPPPGFETPMIPVVKAPPAAPRPPIVSRRDGYSLQVGACRSEDCVTRYRKMLMEHVEVGKIQVVRKAAADGGSQILRVRVAPLGRADAKTLKTKLATLDRRFKDSYVIAVN